MDAPGNSRLTSLTRFKEQLLHDSVFTPVVVLVAALVSYEVIPLNDY